MSRSVAAELGARVDEQRMQFRGFVALLDLVVKHRAAFVQRDDRVVREFPLALAAGRHERESDLEFAGARAECSFRRPVSPRTQHVRLAQAGDFVRGLRGAAVVELCDEMFGVDGSRGPSRATRGRARR
jgi:hypothetical protein